MPITTPETDKQFRMYGSALEVKAAAKASLAMLDTALRNGRDLEGELHADLLMAISHLGKLFDTASETVSRLRPARIEERGYNAADRVGFSSHPIGGCGDGCGGGGCGRGGGCGGCGGNP